MITLDTNEIIEIKTGELRRNYRGYKGTFASFAYNCIQKRALPGFCYEKDLVAAAELGNSTLSIKLSGNHSGKTVMDMMDIALRNMSAFPAEGGNAHFSINVIQEKTIRD